MPLRHSIESCRNQEGIASLPLIQLVILLVLLMLLGLSRTANARNWEDPTQNSVLGTVGISVSSLQLNLKNIENPAVRQISYEPPVRSRTQIGIAYQWFAASVSSANSAKPEEDYLRGTGKSDDIQFRFYFKHFAVELAYQNYQGYYIANSYDLDPNYGDPNPNIQLPELKSQSYLASFTYILSPEEFSLGAAYDLGARQTVSGGSWLFNGTVTKHSIQTPTSIIPVAVTGQYGEVENLRKADLTTITVGAGGGYTLTYMNLFLSGTVLVNLTGQQLSKLDYTDKSVEKSVNANGYHLKVSTGINRSDFVAALIGNIDSTAIPIGNVELSGTTVLGQILFGWRF